MVWNPHVPGACEFAELHFVDPFGGRIFCVVSPDTPLMLASTWHSARKESIDELHTLHSSSGFDEADAAAGYRPSWLLFSIYKTADIEIWTCGKCGNRKEKRSTDQRRTCGKMWKNDALP